MMDTLNNEKIDISSEEHSEISPQEEENMNTAEEGDGVGTSSQEEKQVHISDDDFKKFASVLKMDMAELKGWFVKSTYKAKEFKNFFGDEHGRHRWSPWLYKTYEVEKFFRDRFEYLHPLHVAAREGAVDMVDMLITKAKVDVNIPATEGEDRVKKGLYRGWTALHFAAEGDQEGMVYRLLVTYGADPNVHTMEFKHYPLHVASRRGRARAVKGFLRAERELCHQLNVSATNSTDFPKTTSNKINVNATDVFGCTALHHVAGYPHLYFCKLFRSKQWPDFLLVVQTLLKFPDIKLTIEDRTGQTALDLASQYENWEVFNILRLKITSEVKDYNEPYYKDRQASVDAANAILVGAALIASVTFAAWLQPPLGYSTFYNEQYSNSLSSPPTSYPQYASFDQHPTLKWFWAFNSLSFFLAIATVMSGAQSVLPSHRMTVKQEVAKLQRNLLITSTLLALSMVFVLLAFAIAGLIVIPPVFNFRASMYFTIMIGGGVSGVFLFRLVWNIFRMACVMWNKKSSKHELDPLMID